MTALLTLLTVIALSIVITRFATIALIHTGLSREAARFQARSAFTGTGFTTLEAESLVDHPVRRRIIMLLMMLGNAGIVTVMSSLILTFVGAEGTSDTLTRIGVLLPGLIALGFLSRSRWVDRNLSRLIRWALRRYTRLDVRDYQSLLHLGGDYRVVEFSVEADHWLADRDLQRLALNEEGILVLGIERRNGSYIGAPRGTTEVQAGDTLLAYGRSEAIRRLNERPQGEAGRQEQEQAIQEQREIEQEQARAESA